MPPVEIADEVELYAREWGRHAILRFQPTMFAHGRILRGMWVVKLTLKSDDPALRLWQEQKTEEEPTEDVWIMEPNPDEGKLIENTQGLREPNVRGLDILQMGASGVRAYLERGNMWSGRTEVNSPEQAVKQGQEQREQVLEKTRADARFAGGKIARDQRRSRTKIPFIGVLKDLVTPTRAAKKPRKEK